MTHNQLLLPSFICTCDPDKNLLSRTYRVLHFRYTNGTWMHLSVHAIRSRDHDWPITALVAPVTNCPCRLPSEVLEKAAEEVGFLNQTVRFHLIFVVTYSNAYWWLYTIRRQLPRGRSRWSQGAVGRLLYRMWDELLSLFVVVLIALAWRCLM